MKTPEFRCKCVRTAEFMAARGGVHSAKMHRQRNHGVWSVRDWKLHFAEEKRILIPELRRFNLGWAAERILNDHEVLERTLDRDGTMDDQLLERHSAFEEEMVVELERRMKAA